MDYLTTIRSKAGHALLPLVYGSALIRDPQGRILFQRRKDFDVWGIPGGILEPGESPAACAVRETREETGLEVVPRRLTAILSGPRHEIRYPNGDRVEQTTIYFECSIAGGTLRADGESAALEFFPADRMPPTLPWYRLALDKRNEPEPYFDPPEGSRAEAAEETWRMMRRVAGAAPIILPGATAVIRDERGRILLARRTDTGRWGLPGGLLELGETVAATAIRETEEETGLSILPLRIRGVFGGHRVVFSGGDVVYPISTWFECRVRGGTLRPDGVETAEVEFRDPCALPEMVPGIGERIRSILETPESAVFQKPAPPD